ncbi:hypothetical protein EZV62_010704 [Acer yangbiense]|uniref:PGG domain-containing protein n=1 Tax=Acer yangbiense TaxID=1000413 RepID=A0A5C7I3B9_9ROSI|nr:hypothetical protein EZV62_010704 [Acer yangbiense]
MQLANMSREMENLKANFRQQPVMGEVQVVYPYQQDNHQVSNNQDWYYQEGSQDNPSFTEQRISGLGEQIEHTAAQVGKLAEKALTDLRSGELNSIEVEEPEFVFKSSKGIYDRIDESMRILERVFEEEYGEYEKKVVEVAQESKELISQDVSLKMKIDSLEKERDSSLREIEELKDELAQRDEALEIMKTRECDHLTELAKAKQELEAKRKEVMPFPKDELDLGQGTSSATITKPSLHKSKKKKATTKKSNQVPPSPLQSLKDKQPIQEVLKRPTPRNAMKGDWDEVVKIYSNNPSIHKAKITRSGGTALHIAVSDGKEDIVKKFEQYVMNELLKRASMYEYLDDGKKPQSSPSQPEDDSHDETKPYAIGAGGNITFVKESFENNQQLTSIVSGANQQDQKDAKDSQDKNQKVENRQPHVYELLLKITNMKESVFRKVDHEGNSALHLAARLGDHKPWLIPGAGLQMKWESSGSMPFHFFVRYNRASKSPRDVFTETHKELIKSGGDWLTNTSESCSVVAALIATVAFATSSTVPGGVRSDSGKPTLENEPAFNVFAIASLIALCFSVTALVMFLAILTSRYQERDFGSNLPRKLLVGLTSLFVAIASMLVSFCSGHFFVLKEQLKFAAVPVYAVTCLPITFFAIAQFPLYFDLIWAAFKKVPQRSYKSIPV